jgi:recombination protein RecT
MANMDMVKKAANSVQVKENNFSTFLTSDGVKQKINQIIGSDRGQRFIASVVSAVAVNPALAECEHATILSAALLGESLNLAPSPQMGLYYMVPFNDSKNNRKVATFQMGWKGYLQLAIRTGYYEKIVVTDIREGELVSYDPFNEEYQFKQIDNREKAKVIGYYAMFKLTTGFIKKMYWDIEKMQAHANQYSQAYRSDKKNGWNNSFWTKDFDAMAMKTMLRQLISKWGTMSTEMRSAFEKDMAVLNEEKVEYVDNVPDVVIDNVDTSEVKGTFFTEEEIEKGVQK